MQHRFDSTRATQRLLASMPHEIDKIRKSLIPEVYREIYTSSSVTADTASDCDNAADRGESASSDRHLFVDALDTAE